MNLRRAIFTLLFLVSSCTFTPLNQLLENETYNDALAQFHFAEVKSKYKHLLDIYLQRQFNPQHLDNEKIYDIYIDVNSNLEDLLVQQDSSISVKEVKFNTHYKIISRKTKKVISKGSFSTAVSYAETSSLYSSYVNEEYSYKNGLKEVARQLRLQALITISKDKLSENTAKGNS